MSISIWILVLSWTSFYNYFKMEIIIVAKFGSMLKNTSGWCEFNSNWFRFTSRFSIKQVKNLLNLMSISIWNLVLSWTSFYNYFKIEIIIGSIWFNVLNTSGRCEFISNWFKFTLRLSIKQAIKLFNLMSISI